jgi:hypothetical protein
MPDTEEVVRATEEQRCAIITELEEKLAGLGIEDTWECLSVGGLMGAKFNMCEHHYRQILQRMSDHVTSELVKEQLN